MPSGNYLVVYRKGGVNYKLCRVFFGTDGSYYVTSPYHPAQKAVLVKMTVNYAREYMEVPLEQMVDIASAEDDEKRLKLSHHPDGLVQFSGQGIVSGRDAEGNIRGMGVMSWPLDTPIRGPAFGAVIHEVQYFERADHVKGESCIFNEEELTPGPRPNHLVLEGQYFPPLWRRFIRTQPDGTKAISIVHPAGAVVQLKVLLPPERFAGQGFIGLELYTHSNDPEEEDDTENAPRSSQGTFILSGSTGNLRQNEQGEWIAEGISCMYPRPASMAVRRSVDYLLPSVPGARSPY